MSSNISVFCEKLSSYVACEDDLVTVLYELTELVENETELSELYVPIFRFLENNPKAEIGAPGPLVHLIEKDFPNYLQELVKSLRLKPTSTTVFMANRVLNANIEPLLRGKIFDCLISVSKNKTIDQVVRQEALDFIAYQGS